MKIKKNDTVLVIAGKDRGKRGKVHQALPKEQRVMVAGVNLIKRHMRPRARLRQTGIIQREAPIHVSNVALLCSKCNRPTRVGYTFLADGSKARVCKRCGEVIEEGGRS